jgi:hypothetical protein
VVVVVEKVLTHQGITVYLVGLAEVQVVPMLQIQALGVLEIHQAHLRLKVITEDQQLG